MVHAAAQPRGQYRSPSPIGGRCYAESGGGAVLFCTLFRVTVGGDAGGGGKGETRKAEDVGSQDAVVVPRSLHSAMAEDAVAPVGMTVWVGSLERGTAVGMT